MKKLIITLSIFAALSLNVNAQGDAFFTYQDFDDMDRSTSGGLAAPLLPDRYECIDQSAPIGSGWLLLAGMGAGYAMLRRRKEK